MLNLVFFFFFFLQITVKVFNYSLLLLNLKSMLRKKKSLIKTSAANIYFNFYFVTEKLFYNSYTYVIVNILSYKIKQFVFS